MFFGIDSKDVEVFVIGFVSVRRDQACALGFIPVRSVLRSPKKVFDFPKLFWVVKDLAAVRPAGR